MYDTIIIGAGMSGLAAGIRLAYYDQRVCILERHYTIGGLNSFYRLRGRDYDVGLHAVTNFTPTGHQEGPVGAAAAAAAVPVGGFRRWRRRSARRSRFPAWNCGSATTSACWKRRSPAQFPGEQDNFQRLLRRLVDYDELAAGALPVSARAGAGRDASATRCWSRCCSAR